MKGLFARILSRVFRTAEDAMDAGIHAAHAVLRADRDSYRHLLWQMREDVGSDTDAWAGPARIGELQEKYPTVDALLDAEPGLARYRDPENGEGPLFWACFYGPLPLVERLVAMGARPRSTTSDSILIWFKKGGMEFIPRGCTTLMMAAAGGRTEVVRYLLEQGVPADAEASAAADTKGVTALFMAARGRGNPEIIRMLAEAGGDPNRGDSIGFTPAGEAAARGAGDVLEALVEAGADLTVPSGSKSVMELAAQSGDVAAMRPIVMGTFGRVLTLDHVTAALASAAIPHEVVPRGEVDAHGADLIVHMTVYAKIMDDDHWELPDTPDYYVWSRRSWDDISAIDLEEEMEAMNIGARRFASDGEIKAVLGIAEGDLTPFAEVNDAAGKVVFQFRGNGGEGKVALEAFDAHRVVVLSAGDVGRALAAFAGAVGPPPRHP